MIYDRRPRYVVHFQSFGHIACGSKARQPVFATDPGAVTCLACQNYVWKVAKRRKQAAK